jgi:Fis family transcriptional regulator
MSEAIRDAVREAVLMSLATSNGSGELYGAVVSVVEVPLLMATLQHYRGNQSLVAARLGLNRATLRKKLREHDIDPRVYRR